MNYSQLLKAPLKGLMVLNTAVALERFVAIYFKSDLNAPLFMNLIQKLVLAGHVERAIKLCNGLPHKGLAKVIKTYLVMANEDEERLNIALEKIFLELKAQLMQRVPLLEDLAYGSLVAGALTLIGDLASSHIDQVEDSAKAKHLQILKDLSLSLSVFLSTWLAHHILAHKASSMLEDIHRQLLSLKDIFLNLRDQE